VFWNVVDDICVTVFRLLGVVQVAVCATGGSWGERIVVRVAACAKGGSLDQRTVV